MVQNNKGIRKTRYGVREIYDHKLDVSSRVYADLPLNTPLMFIVSRYKDGRKRMGFKRLPTPTKHSKLIGKE